VLLTACCSAGSDRQLQVDEDCLVFVDEGQKRLTIGLEGSDQELLSRVLMVVVPGK
jgi:hypothetical protein